MVYFTIHSSCSALEKAYSVRGKDGASAVYRQAQLKTIELKNVCAIPLIRFVSSLTILQIDLRQVVSSPENRLFFLQLYNAIVMDARCFPVRSLSFSCDAQSVSILSNA